MATVRKRLTGIAALESLAVAASLGFYAVFIGRSGFTIAGRAYYTLIDDAMISMTFARSFADGRGLTWQPGPRVEGYTNFLWTIWMAILHLLPFSERYIGLAVMVSGAAILVATMLVVRAICRRLVSEREYVPGVAMLLVGLCYPLDFWTLRGMETGLCALLLALAAWLALGLRPEASVQRLAALGGVLAAAVLTRDDMAVPAIVIVAFACYSQRARWRRALLTVGGILVAALAGHAAFRLAYYGDALPNTYYLKLEGIALGTRLHRGIVGVVWTTATGLSLTIGLAAVAVLCAWRTTRRLPLAFLAVTVLSEFAYSTYVGGDFAEQYEFANRFIAPVLPLAIVMAAIGMSDLVRGNVADRTRRAAVAFGAALLAAAAVVQGHGWHASSVLYIDGAPPYASGRVAIALAAAALLAYFAIRPAQAPSRARIALFTALVVLTLATLDYGPIRTFAHEGPLDRSVERLETGRALIYRRFSTPANAAALTGAGNWRYFSHRRGVDLLGKVDTTIAHGPSHPIVFKPGHTKWNYDYSIGRLRPDALTDLTFATPAERCRIAAWGYRQIAPHFFVREGARGIDVPQLTASLSSFDPRPMLPGCTRPA